MRRIEVLIIDLNPSVSQVLKECYHVSEYVNQIEVIDGLKFRQKHHLNLPDLIICSSSGIGAQTYHELSGWMDSLSERIPLIIIGNRRSKTEVDEALSFGADDFVDVSITDTDLLLKVGSFLKLRKQKVLAEELSHYRVPLDKRVFDVLVSGILILMLSPVFLAIMLAIRLESKGPVFYWQPRVGSGYRIFRFFKFRSMRVNADKMVDNLKKNNHYQSETTSSKIDQAVHAGLTLIGDSGPVAEMNYLSEKANDEANSFFKVKNDPRITKVGKFIRNTSLDELPQLINVFIGDMSIVGNRPLPLYEAEKLTDDRWAERFMAPSGITGLWQVTERGKAKTSEDSRKLLDIEYARTHNLLLDLKILIKTPIAALQHENV